MELDQLRYFLKAAERGNFTHAAKELAVSQPALSRAIQKLEREIGQPVFERKTRSVSLTDAGVLLQARARQALAILDDAKTEIDDDGRSGCLRIGAIPTIAPYFLPDILRRFTRDHPRSTLLVREETTDRLIKSCTDGQIDLAILALPVSAKYLHIEHLFTEELLLVLPADHELTQRKRIRMSDVEPYPFVLLDEAHCLSDNIISFCRRRSVQPVAVEHANQLATVQELVSLGHGVSMVPMMARMRDTSDRRVYRSLSGDRPERRIALVTNPYRFHSRLLKKFVTALGAHCRNKERLAATATTKKQSG